MEDWEKEIQEFEAAAELRWRSIVDFVWLIIAVFLLVGSFTPLREQAAYALVFFTMLWMLNQVIVRGIKATKTLFFSKKSDSNNNTDNKEQ